MQLFYNENIDSSISQFVLDIEESRHLIKVLRKKEGDQFYITNGKGFLFKAEIVDANIKKCKAQIIESTKKHKKDFWLHIAIAPTKSNDRFEWFLEKATEIGVHEITPIVCDHSERKIVKKERLQKVIMSAMKQSLQTFLPKLNDAVTFDQFLSAENKSQLFIAHCEETEKNELKRSIQPDTDITLLIGPEGDFSSNEINNALSKKYVPVSLGDNRLRTETAAIVGCTIVNMINNG